MGRIASHAKGNRRMYAAIVENVKVPEPDWETDNASVTRGTPEGFVMSVTLVTTKHTRTETRFYAHSVTGHAKGTVPQPDLWVR